MSIRKQVVIACTLFVFLPMGSWAQTDGFNLLQERQSLLSPTINRKTLVRRNNPTTHHLGHQQFLIGEGRMQFRVDATALQTFMADPQTLLNVGLNLSDTTLTSRLDMTLDRWTGKAESRFHHNGRYFHVETVCAPSYQQGWAYGRPTFATRIASDSIFEVQFYTPLTAAAHTSSQQPSMQVIKLKNHAAISIGYPTAQGMQTQWYTVSWRGNASLRKRGNKWVLCCKGSTVKIEGRRQKSYNLDIIINKAAARPHNSFFNMENITPFTDYALRTATGWNNFWNECGIADFSAVQSPEAQKLEARLVEALYNYTANTPDDWWLQAPLTAYGFAKQIVAFITRTNRQGVAPTTIWQHPEFIAAALLTLRAYTLPQVAERFGIPDAERQNLYTTVYNAFAPNVAQTLENLKANQQPVPDELSRDVLQAIGERWLAPADSLTLFAPSPLPSNSSSPLQFNSPLAPLFHLPLATPELPDNLLLLSIASSRWPQDWKVKTENILPLP